jgi:hypothetical protein
VPLYKNGARRGALVKKNANLTAQDLTTATAITWDTEIYDTDAFHDTGSNTNRLTVPPGVVKVVVKCQIRIESNTADTWIAVFIRRSTSGGAATADWDGHARTALETGAVTASVNLCSAAVVVGEGDYFDVAVQSESDTSVDIIAARSWFAIEVIE